MPKPGKYIDDSYSKNLVFPWIIEETLHVSVDYYKSERMG